MNLKESMWRPCRLPPRICVLVARLWAVERSFSSRSSSSRLLSSESVAARRAHAGRAEDDDHQLQEQHERAGVNQLPY